MDEAMQRIRKTPPVFHRGKDIYQSRRCELRANLLPSILQPPSDSAYPTTAAVDFEEPKAPDPVVETDGEFYRAYQQTLAKRDEDEKKVKVFLGKDKTFPPSAWDPAQVAAENCNGLKDLMETKAANFRRPKQTLVNTSSDLPFQHPQQAVDLQELTNILTLDMQLREMPWKGTNKSPGFVSLQLASRVPLRVRNTKHLGGVFETEPMPENDLHVLRMDLHVGEVRQIGYNMESRFFKGSQLADRMAAVVEPERSALSGMVQMLRAKEAEAFGLAGVLSDVLRDVAQPIPPPDLDAWVEARVSVSSGGNNSAARLQELLTEPRRTLERLLDAANGLSTLAQQLVPSLAKAIDNLALISVREVDRIASRCHEDLEAMLEKLASSEKERQELDLVMTRISGNAGRGKAGADLQSRNKILEADIRQQEKSYAEVLKEKTELEATMAENAKITAGLSQKVENLEVVVANLRKDRKALVDCFSVLVEDLPESEEHDDSEEAKAAAARELAGLLSIDTEEVEAKSNPTSPRSLLGKASIFASPKHGNLLAIARAGTVASAFTKRSTIARRDKNIKDTKKDPKAAPVLSFAVSTGVQTNTDFFFSDNLRLEDEMATEQFDDVMVTAYRLYAMLCRYQWNDGANRYLLRPEEDLSEDSEGDLLPPRAQASSSPRAGRQRASVSKLSRIQHLKSKVQKAQQQAANAQMEEEIRRLERLAEEGFDTWVAQLCEDAGARSTKATQPPFVPEDLLKAMLELVHGEGMRARIRKLEDHLAQLLPLADNRSQLPSNSGTDVGFWKRVLRSVRHSMAARRGSTQLKAQAAHMMAINAATGSNKSQQLDNLPRLLGELAAIWASLPDKPEKDKYTGLYYRPFHQVLQEGVNGFYLKSHGRHKQVEQAVFSLCRAVLDQGSNPKVALFAVVCDILQPGTIGDRIPAMTREVEVDLGHRLLRKHLSNLPPDTAYCLCDFMRSLKGLWRSRKFAGAPDGHDKKRTPSKEASGFVRQTSPGKRSASKGASGEDQADAMLPLQLVLAAGHASVARRSQVTATYFHILLYAFAEIPEVREQVPGSVAEVDKNPEEVDPQGESHDDRLSVNSVESQGVESGESQNEALLVSNLLAASSWRARQAESSSLDWASADAETAEKLWDAIVQAAPTPEEVQLGIRPHLRHSASQAQFCASGMTPIAEVLVENCGLLVPYEFVSRALRSSSGSDEVTNATLHWLVGFWRQRGGAGSILCRESYAYWAALWALALERAREIELMGKFFELFDTSQDGWLQFSEFTAFMNHISPSMSQEEIAQLFMLAADDTAAEMTKDAFITLSLRLGVSTDLDELEKLVALREDEVAFWTKA